MSAAYSYGKCKSNKYTQGNNFNKCCSNDKNYNNNNNEKQKGRVGGLDIAASGWIVMDVDEDNNVRGRIERIAD